MKVLIDRAIVEQALEALGLAKLNGKAGLHPAEIGEIADAITALRAALAQGPVAICCNCLGTKQPHADDPEWKGRCDCEPPQLAEPAQEPVAKVELMMTGGNAGLATRIVEIEDHLRERLRPGQQLYTAPPQRKN